MPASKLCRTRSESSPACSSYASPATGCGRCPSRSAGSRGCATWRSMGTASRGCPSRSASWSSCAGSIYGETCSRRCPAGSSGCRHSSGSTCDGTGSRGMRRSWRGSRRAAAACSPERQRRHERSIIWKDPPVGGCGVRRIGECPNPSQRLASSDVDRVHDRRREASPARPRPGRGHPQPGGRPHPLAPGRGRSGRRRSAAAPAARRGSCVRGRHRGSARCRP